MKTLYLKEKFIYKYFFINKKLLLFVLSYHKTIAAKSKPFTDDELKNEYMETASEMFSPIRKSLRLSRVTVTYLRSRN